MVVDGKSSDERAREAIEGLARRGVRFASTGDRKSILKAISALLNESPTRDHRPDCPCLKFPDDGDLVPCICGGAPDPLHAVLAREARLREAAEYIKDLATSEHTLSELHAAADDLEEALDTESPLTQAAAEVLEAARKAAQVETEHSWGLCSRERWGEAQAALRGAAHRYRALLRGQEGGGE